MFRTIAVTIGALIGIFLLPVVAESCSCPYPPRTLIDEYNDSELVVVAKLQSITDPISRDERGTTAWVVEKVYKGEVKPGSTLRLWNGTGSDCVRYFDAKGIGKRFLLYLGPPSREYPRLYTQQPIIRAEPAYVIECNRSAGVEHATRDVSFLDKYEELKDKQRVSGTFTSGMHSGLIVAGIKIVIRGQHKTVETVTDKTGYFETYDLPTGSYSVEFPAQPGWQLEEWMLRGSRPDEPSMIGPPRVSSNWQIPIDLTSRRHIEMNLFFQPSGSVGGRVISPNAQPVRNVYVRLMSVIDFSVWSPSTTTNSEGEFLFEKLKPGKYFIAVYNNDLISSRQPFPTVFYQGTNDKADARTVDVGISAITDLIVQVPTLVKLDDVKGKVTYADNLPVADASVRFTSAGQPFESEYARTNEAGEFVLKIPVGANGEIAADLQLNRATTSQCPEHQPLFSSAAEHWAKVVTNKVKYPFTSPSVDLTLKAAILSCKR